MAADPQSLVDKYTPKLPPQIQKQLDEANALRQQMSGQPPAEPQPPAPPAPPPVAPASASLTPPVQPQPAPSAPAAPAPEDSWEQRAKSTQGRLENALQLNQQLNERMGLLEQTIAVMQANGATPPDPNTPPPAKPKLMLVTDQERADYGEELLTVVGKRAKEEYFPEFDQLSDRLKRLEGRVDGTVQIVTRQQTTGVHETLDQQVPNWRVVNKAPEFKAWLNTIDPFSGRVRLEMLQEAFSRHEAGRVVSFFQGFTAAAGPPSSQGQPPSTPSSPPAGGFVPGGVNGTTGGALTLEQLAAPGRARSAPDGNVPPDKPVYTAAWIAQFGEDRRRGKYRGREADADLIERDIYQAQHEGRILP